MASCADINIKVGDSSKSCRSCQKTKGADRPGVKYCLDCRAWFCSDCLRPHGIFCEGHTLSDKATSSTPSYRPCTVHKDTAVMYYCVSCKHCICPLCRIDDGAHKEHACISLADRIKDVRAEVQTALASLKINEKTAEEKITELNHGFSSVSARLKDAERQFQKQVQALKEEHRKLKDELEQELLEKKKSFTNEIKKLQKYFNDADVALDVTETSNLSKEVNSPLPELHEFREGLHDAGVKLMLGKDLTDQQKSDVLKSLKPVTSTPPGLHGAGLQIMLGNDLTDEQVADIKGIAAVMTHNISSLIALNPDHQQVIKALKLWGITPDNLTGEQTAALIRQGSRVKRGRDWKWGDQDKNGPGTALDSVGSDKWVRVRWDSGVTADYRMGAEGAYDLRLSE